MTSTLLRAQKTTLLSKVRRWFFQILWPSQKTQTLHKKILSNSSMFGNDRNSSLLRIYEKKKCMYFFFKNHSRLCLAWNPMVLSWCALEEELPIRKLWQALKNAAFFDRFTTSRAERNARYSLDLLHLWSFLSFLKIEKWTSSFLIEILIGKVLLKLNEVT